MCPILIQNRCVINRFCAQVSNVPATEARHPLGSSGCSPSDLCPVVCPRPSMWALSRNLEIPHPGKKMISIFVVKIWIFFQPNWEIMTRCSTRLPLCQSLDLFLFSPRSWRWRYSSVTSTWGEQEALLSVDDLWPTILSQGQKSFRSGKWIFVSGQGSGDVRSRHPHSVGQRRFTIFIRTHTNRFYITTSAMIVHSIMFRNSRLRRKSENRTIFLA